MARMTTDEPTRSMSALATSAATNSPHEPPAKARPIRSMTCAHLLMAERASHGSARLIIWFRYQTYLRSAIDKEQAEQSDLPPGGDAGVALLIARQTLIVQEFAPRRPSRAPAGAASGTYLGPDRRGAIVDKFVRPHFLLRCGSRRHGISGV